MPSTHTEIACATAHGQVPARTDERRLVAVPTVPGLVADRPGRGGGAYDA